MKKYIVTTTIQSPTRATKLFCKKTDWNFVVVGDTATPHEEYRVLERKYKNFTYLDPLFQEKHFKDLSDAIGWKSIQRRNIGFVFAYNEGADIIASVDDDNIPYETWGTDLLIGKTIDLDCYENPCGVFDPLSITKDNYLWHRGYPIEYLKKRSDITYVGKIKRKVLIQADLWDGDPDIDAMARLVFKPVVKYGEIRGAYCSSNISPFNSQNTFFAREVVPYYAVLPHVGRMDDIWGGYILQHHFPNSLAYNKATVYQDRNKQDLVTNLEKEILGYRKTLEFIHGLSTYTKLLPDQTNKFYEIYKGTFKA